MKKLLIPLVIVFLSFCLFAQVEEHVVTVTNIEVAVTVMDGNRFVENLTIDDFEVYEDGIPQQIEALYLIKKASIEREEALKRFHPNLSRQYYLLFQITDHNPQLEDAVDHFIHQVIQPGDSLSIWTSVNKYDLSSQALEKTSKETIAKEMKKIIRKDTQIGASHYRELMRDLKRLARGISSVAGFEGPTMSDIETDSTSSMFGLDFLLPRYRETLQKIEQLRIFDQKNLLTFIDSLKRQPGEQIVFYFYQREFRPEISPSLVNKMQGVFQDDPNIMSQIQDLFQFYYREISFDVGKIRQAFADSSVVFNFLFMSKQPENISGVHMREQSEDVFSALSEAAKASGGVVDTSQNPGLGFRNAVDSSQQYYLLYYSPQGSVRDGKFKTIEVRVKDKNYKIRHRQGYFAN